jgi:starch synthase
MSRITHQKMADVLVDALPQILARETQVVVLGRGVHALEGTLVEVAQRFPGQLAVVVGYNEELAHQVLAGADMLLAPARFEPCGLTQMYALRYGTVPIVSRVGGLRETVVDTMPHSLADGTATGFVFDEQTVGGLVGAVDRALEAYRTQRAWRTVQCSGMKVDFSWARSAGKYEQIYAALAASRPVAGAVFPLARAADGDPAHRAPRREAQQAEL